MKTPEDELLVDLKISPFCAQFKNPVVLLSDVETLLRSKAVAHEAGWRMEFKKSGPQDREPWGIIFWLDAHQRIEKFQLPLRLSEVLGNEFIMRAIEAVGRAEVSIGKGRIYMDLNFNVQKKQVLELMGKPFEEQLDRLIYHFGEEDNVLRVMVRGKESINAMVIEANGYGLEVQVHDPQVTLESEHSSDP